MAAGHVRVFALWGAHRQAPGAIGRQPSSIDKGVPELSAIGHDVRSIYPIEVYRRLPWIVRALARGRGMYFFSMLYVVWHIRMNDVAYTTDRIWANRMSRLKKFKILRNRLIYKWAGHDLGLVLGGENPHAIFKFHKDVVDHCDVIICTSASDIINIKTILNCDDRKILFWPTAVDTRFYREIVAAEVQNDVGLVAVGSDHKRDWRMAVEIARHGIKVTIVTEDAEAKRFVDSLGTARPALLDIAFAVGLRRSAEIMAGAKALLITTLPNERFSGATTVGVAAALGKPLILDEPYDLTAYGLIAGYNCETFERGDLASALAAIDRVVSHGNHAARLGANIACIADSLDIRHYAKFLSAAFERDRPLASFSSARSAVPVEAAARA